MLERRRNEDKIVQDPRNPPKNVHFHRVIPFIEVQNYFPICIHNLKIDCKRNFSLSLVLILLQRSPKGGFSLSPIFPQISKSPSPKSVEESLNERRWWVQQRRCTFVFNEGEESGGRGCVEEEEEEVNRKNFDHERGGIASAAKKETLTDEKLVCLSSVRFLRFFPRFLGIVVQPSSEDVNEQRALFRSRISGGRQTLFMPT